MMNIRVEMYGLSPFTEANHVDLALEDGATTSDLLHALGMKMPELEGHVKEAGKNRLIESYGLYVNGRVLDPSENVALRPGDRVAIILLAVGG